MTRYAFLDEAGDPGLKFGRGSSTHLVIGIVLVDDPLPLQSAIRRRFLQVVAAHDVAVAGLAVDKQRLVGRPEARRMGDLYTEMTRLASAHHRGLLDQTHLTMDRRATSRTAQRTINAALRQAVNTNPRQPALRGIKHAPSLGNNLIQVADMVSGAILASVADQNDVYLNLVRVRLRSIAYWDEQIAVWSEK